MASRLQSQVDRLLLTQVSHGELGSRSRTLVILGPSLLKVHSLEMVGVGVGGGHSLGDLFCIFNSVGCPFLK